MSATAYVPHVFNWGDLDSRVIKDMGFKTPGDVPAGLWVYGFETGTEDYSDVVYLTEGNVDDLSVNWIGTGVEIDNGEASLGKTCYIKLIYFLASINISTTMDTDYDRKLF